MHITSKIRRCLNNIDCFVSKPYPECKKVSYESTTRSLMHYKSVLNSHLSRPRRENSKGSHYLDCFDTAGHCRCMSDNQIILNDIEAANRLMKGM
jgi:hypothetical protein